MKQKNFLYLLIILFFLFLVGCRPAYEEKIIGSWRGEHHLFGRVLLKFNRDDSVECYESTYGESSGVYKITDSNRIAISQECELSFHLWDIDEIEENSMVLSAGVHSIIFNRTFD
jgi:hypothetical protein